MRPFQTLVAACAALVWAVLWAGPAAAERGEQMQRLLEALRVADTVAIMREEGMLYGDELAQEMMPEANVDSWRMRVGRIYDTGKMRDLVEKGLMAELEGVPLGPLTAFFTAPLGAEIIDLELAAREAFLDPETEAAAKDRYQEMSREGAPIINQIDTLTSDSDLIEMNVMGILNSNLMLYRGLADGGAYDLSEEDILMDVWAQEDEVREDSAAWIGAYLLTAYQPLEEDELDRYIAFWRTSEGQALNRALFATFDRMYEEMSYLMGQAVAQHMRGQDL